ncbi:hypothetical protein [Flaviflexus massiliensis]|uniref:hypothetical protein n=1 Tax=Flaviflexus massiliensis TaxID=1522309 RepID=UPI0006D53B64|nr:hypothetical protein [Flaviflexus massiliensis]
MKKSILRTTVLGCVLALTLAACGGDGDDTETTEETSAAEEVDETESETEADEPEEDEATETEESDETESIGTEEPEESESGDAAEDADEGSESSVSGTPVEINAEFVDEETSDKITIVQALRDVPSERDSVYIEEGGEVVYIEVQIEAGSDFGGSISSNDFYIQYDGEEDRAKGVLRDEISAQGLEPFENFSRRDGSSESLWLAFTIEGERADTYTGVYVRPETKILGEDQVLPEFRSEFTIPAP